MLKATLRTDVYINIKKIPKPYLRLEEVRNFYCGKVYFKKIYISVYFKSLKK